MIEALGSNPLGGVLDDIQQRLGGFWASLWAPISDGWPIWWSWGVFVLVVLGVVALGIIIRIFIPSDWTKIPLLLLFVVILAAVGWMTGRYTMYYEMLKRLEAERKKKVVKPFPPPPDPDRWRPW